MLTRREFLGTFAALAACGDDLAPRLELCVQTWCFRAFPMAEALSMTRALGLTRVELAYLHVPNATEARAALETYGLVCPTYAPGVPVDAHDEPTVRAAFDIARALGAGTVMVDPPPASLDLVERLAVEYDLRVGIHNHVGSHYTLPVHVQRAIAGRDERVGAIIDTGHYLRMGVDPVETIHMFAGRLHGLHLKDVVAADVNAPDAVLGEGILDVDAVACALREVRIPAHASLSLEYEGEPDAPYDALSRAISRFARGAGYCK